MSDAGGREEKSLTSTGEEGPDLEGLAKGGNEDPTDSQKRESTGAFRAKDTPGNRWPSENRKVWRSTEG